MQTRRGQGGQGYLQKKGTGLLEDGGTEVPAEGWDRGPCRQEGTGVSAGGGTGVLADGGGHKGPYRSALLRPTSCWATTVLGLPPTSAAAGGCTEPPPAWQGLPAALPRPPAPHGPSCPAGSRRANRLWQCGPLGRETAHARPRPAPCRARLEFASCPDALKRKRMASGSQPCRGRAGPWHPLPRDANAGPAVPKGGQSRPHHLHLLRLFFFSPPTPALNSSFSGAERRCQAPTATTARQGTRGTSKAEGPHQRWHCGQVAPARQKHGSVGPLPAGSPVCRFGDVHRGTEAMEKHRWARMDRQTGRSARRPRGVGQAEAQDPAVGVTASSRAQHCEDHPGEPAGDGLQSPRGAPIPWGSQGPPSPVPRAAPCRPQLCYPRWELPTRASTHHPTSPTPMPRREPPAPRGLPGTSERPPAVRALGCSSRSFQWAGHTAGGLGTHQGGRQRACPTPQHQHTLAPRQACNDAPKSPRALMPAHNCRRSREPTCRGIYPSRGQAGWAQLATLIPAGTGQTAAGCPWEEGTATAGWNRSVKKRLLRALSGAS